MIVGLWILLFFNSLQSEENVGIGAEKYSYDICSCDLDYDYCDINCCCDKDCSGEQMAVFSKCADILPNFDEKLCSHPQMYRAILTVKKEIMENKTSLLCIERDNNEERNFYKAIYDGQYLDDVVNNNPLLSVNMFSNVGITRHNFVFIKLQSGIIGTLGLPYSLFSNLCDFHDPIKFMNDKKSECIQFIAHLPSDCVTFPALDATTYNQIEILNYTDEITTLLCEYSLENCENVTVESPNYLNNYCQNVVAEVHYVVTYDFPSLIRKFSVKYLLKSINYTGTGVFFNQKFSITFEQYGDLNGFVTSGNPGYIKGSPILAGWLSKDNIKFNSSSLFVLPAFGSEESCLKGQYHGVKFGENVITSCVLRMNTSNLRGQCDYILQEANLFLFKNFPTHIGVFGNADPFVLGDWIPILIKNAPNILNTDCTSFTLALQIEIAFVYIGLSSNPQAKIIGTTFEYSSPVPVKSCSDFFFQENSTLLIPFHISLSFLDVTEQPEPIFAPLPTIKIKIPYDLFYPFVSDGQNIIISRNLLYCLLIITYTINVLYK